MLDSAQAIMSVAYILFLLSVLPNIREVWRNRGKLRGFNLFGVTATGTGLLIVQFSLYLDSAFIPVIIGMPNVMYWIMLNYLLWKQHFDGKKTILK